MSIELVAIFEREQPEDLRGLPELLARVDWIPVADREWCWSLETDKFTQPEQELNCYGEVGLWGEAVQRTLSKRVLAILARVGRKAIHITMPVSWLKFLSDMPTQLTARFMARSVCRNLDRERCIYVPDCAWPPSGARSLVSSEEEQCFDEFLTWLNENCGAPATSIGAIYKVDKEGCWSGDGYFVDHFNDLPEEAPAGTLDNDPLPHSPSQV